jgi:hypothetical protein
VLVAELKARTRQEAHRGPPVELLPQAAARRRRPKPGGQIYRNSAMQRLFATPLPCYPSHRRGLTAFPPIRSDSGLRNDLGLVWR